MKILEIDYDYYGFPDGISCMDVFLAYVKENYHSFIKLNRFETENCVFPYLIQEEAKEVFLNVAAMEKFSQVEATVLSREEYDARLKQVVQKKCLDCVHYEEATDEDNLKGHRDMISLDGECGGYDKKEE